MTFKKIFSEIMSLIIIFSIVGILAFLMFLFVIKFWILLLSLAITAIIFIPSIMWSETVRSWRELSNYDKELAKIEAYTDGEISRIDNEKSERDLYERFSVLFEYDEDILYKKAGITK